MLLFLPKRGFVEKFINHLLQKINKVLSNSVRENISKTCMQRKETKRKINEVQLKVRVAQCTSRESTNIKWIKKTHTHKIFSYCIETF